MKKSISSIIKKCAEDLSKLPVEALTKEDVENLDTNSPILIKKIRDNVEKGTQDPLKGLSADDKVLLLSFVVYKRQNIATAPKEDPNMEDSAKILHGKVYKLTGDKKQDKDILENIDKDLTKQLSKAGLDIKKK